MISRYSTDALDLENRKIAIEYVKNNRNKALSDLEDWVLKSTDQFHLYITLVTTAQFDEHCLLTDDNMFFLCIMSMSRHGTTRVFVCGIEVNTSGEEITFKPSCSALSKLTNHIDFYGAAVHSNSSVTTDKFPLDKFLSDNNTSISDYLDDFLVSKSVDITGKDYDLHVTSTDVSKSCKCLGATIATPDIALTIYLFPSFDFDISLKYVKDELIEACVTMRYTLSFTSSDNVYDANNPMSGSCVVTVEKI